MKKVLLYVMQAISMIVGMAFLLMILLLAITGSTWNEFWILYIIFAVPCVGFLTAFFLLNRYCKNKGCLIAFVCIFTIFILIAAILFGITKIGEKSFDKLEIEQEEIKNVETLVNAQKYGNISMDDLKAKIGEPTHSETWTNKTSKGDFEVTTCEYDFDNIHYEFIIADNKVVRLTLYSQKYWTREGEYFGYDKKENILYMFGISHYTSLKKTKDTGATQVYSSSNGTFAEVEIFDINSNENCFGLIKFTYDKNYFD